MTTKIYSRQIFKFALFLFISIFSNEGFAQTAPDNTRLFQLNTIKGSRLTLVESSDDFVYHIGTINNSEVGFDNISATNVGLDDLFVLKSNSATGANSWFKTFNAGVKGVITPRYVYVDSSENIYVFAQFKGSVTVGNKTFSSVNATDTFLMKIDNNGNAVWADYLENGYNSQYKTKCVTEGANTYFVYGGNRLLKLDTADGSVIFNNVYNNVELKTVAVKDQDLYLAGATTASGAVLGSEYFTDSFVGFIVKGDRNANFTASVKTSKSDSFQTFADISDIAVSGDGNILLTGFYTRNAINLVTETGTSSFTYNPNANYNNNSRLYNYVAKVDLNLGAVSFFRTSSPINQEGNYNIRTDVNSTKLIPYGNSGDFRQINYISDRYNTILSYINPNGTLTSLSPLAGSGTQKYISLLSYNNIGGYSSGSQLTKYSFRMSASGTGYTTTDNTNIRVFTTSKFGAENGNLSWSKQKTNSIGGSFNKQFQKHLNSAKSDIFFTALVEGKGQFFNVNFDNGQSVYSRYITRLAADGTTKWIARFTNSGLGSLENVSQNFAAVDKDDNFYILCSKPSQNSTFTDGFGTVINFSKNFMDGKVLIKLDKDGKYIWGKEIGNTTYTGVLVDSLNNVYVTGSTGDLYLEGQNYSSTLNSLHVLKFDSTGNLSYVKLFPSDVSFYSILPVLDAQNNLYAFMEPINRLGLDFKFGNVTIPASESNLDLLMLKFDNNGNAVFGKNFFANSVDYKYAWPNDVVYDGQDFVMMGSILGETNDSNFIGLDFVNIPKIYPQSFYSPFFAKIKTDGTVIWQKVLDSNNSNPGNYTNISLDENKNIYMYYSVKDKVNFNGTEFSFNATEGNKILLKLDTNGNRVYHKIADKGMQGYSLVYVIENDKINVSGFTTENNFLNYKINNQNATNLYVATFGTIDQKYLTPMSNYLTLTNANISNNPGNANTFIFDLITNVNWTAISDQNWLSLSASQAKNIYNTVSGNGDAKLTVTADTNNTGSTRSSSILISGDGGVASKTVVVTQAGVLANQEAKTFVTVIYPNPTSDILNIQTEQKISKIEILDTSGKLLKSNSGSGKTINVSNLSKGIYLIKIYADKNIINSKFIKN